MRRDLNLAGLRNRLKVHKGTMFSVALPLQRWCCTTAALITALLLFPADTAVVQAARRTEVATRVVEVQMRNVMYHFTADIAVRISSLHGQLVPTKGGLSIFDDKESFTLQIGTAETAMAPESLANVLNSYVFARRDAPLKDISICIESAGRLRIKGRLHSKGDISFETEGGLSPTPDGKIRQHTEKIKALRLPVKGLMDLLGVDIADLIKTGKVRGVKAEKDDLILDPETLLPPPHIAATSFASAS